MLVLLLLADWLFYVIKLDHAGFVAVDMIINIRLRKQENTIFGNFGKV